MCPEGSEALMDLEQTDAQTMEGDSPSAVASILGEGRRSMGFLALCPILPVGTGSTPPAWAPVSRQQTVGAPWVVEWCPGLDGLGGSSPDMCEAPFEPQCHMGMSQHQGKPCGWWSSAVLSLPLCI